MTAKSDFKYWAFISYSHRDEKFCRWLHSQLDGYKTPAPLIGQMANDGSYAVPKKLYPIFRDRDELPAGADLSDAITSALQSARYLVVICSPHSAQSPWVNKEITYFESLGRQKYILPIILDGEPNAPEGLTSMVECFPPALRAPKEPLAADARETKDGKEAALMKLQAGLLGVGLEDLVNRELEREKQQARRNGLLAVFMLFLALSALVSGWFAWEQKKEADALRQEAVARTKDAEYNYGLALAEKANWALSSGRGNEGQIYAAHALARIEKGRSKEAETMRLEIMGSRLHHPRKPMLSPYERANITVSPKALSPDKKLLASIGADRMIWLWDVTQTEPRPVATLRDHGAVGVGFSSDGKVLISQDAHGQSSEWVLDDLATADWRTRAVQDEKHFGLKLEGLRLVPTHIGNTKNTSDANNAGDAGAWQK